MDEAKPGRSPKAAVMSCARTCAPSFSTSWTTGSQGKQGVAEDENGDANGHWSMCGALRGGGALDAADSGTCAGCGACAEREAQCRGTSPATRRVAEARRQCARIRRPRGDVPDDRIG